MRNDHKIVLNVWGTEYVAYCSNAKEENSFLTMIVPKLLNRDDDSNRLIIMNADLPYDVTVDGKTVITLRVAKEFARHYKSRRFASPRCYKKGLGNDYKGFSEACFKVCASFDVLNHYDRHGFVKCYDNNFRKFVDFCIIPYPRCPWLPQSLKADEKKMLEIAGIEID